MTDLNQYAYSRPLTKSRSFLLFLHFDHWHHSLSQCPGHLSVIIAFWGGQIHSSNTLKQGNIKCPIHHSMHGREWGQRKPRAIWAICWSWELLEFGPSPFSLFSSSNPTSNHFPSFGDWPMWHARFSLDHRLQYKSLLDTWKHSLARLQLAWK